MKIKTAYKSMDTIQTGVTIPGSTLTEQGLAVTPMQLVRQVMTGSSANTSPYESGRYQEDNTFLRDEKDLATAFEQTKAESKKVKKIKSELQKLAALEDNDTE